MYSNEPGKFEGKVYRDLCLSISGQLKHVEWDQFNSYDWEDLYQTANNERVAPLLYRSLKNSKSISDLRIPDDFIYRLRKKYYDTWVKNSILFQELGTILDRFEYAGINAVLLKGASLAASIYPNLGLRPMRDLDILVHQTQIVDAVRIVESMDYIEHIPAMRPEVNDLIAYHVKFKKNDEQKLFLEIHTSLIGGEALSYSVPMDWFWEQIEPFSWECKVPGSSNKPIMFDNAHQFTPSAQLIYLSAHAVLQHGLGGTTLIWLYDIHRLLDQMGEMIDWDLVLTRAEVFNWASAVYMALYQTQSVFNTPIPGDVHAILKYSSDERISELIKIKSNPAETRMVEEWQKLIAMNWKDRFSIIAGLIIPSPGYMRWRYKPSRSWSLPYYYLVRWKDIFVDGIKSIPYIFRLLSK